MKTRKFLVPLTAVLLLLATQAVAQPWYDDGYTNFWPPEPQTKSVPAGTVFEPGSQLLFLLDTGVNLKKDYGSSANYSKWSALELAGAQKPTNQAFISVTNTNPTDAVTVHFRYFSAECEDILDFLVVLTCNDTMLVDPFNFTIPGAGKNVAQRFFGASGINPQSLPACTGTNAPCYDPTLPAIPGSLFGDGRFLLHVTAAGDPYWNKVGSTPPWMYDQADWLFPYELITAIDLEHCLGVKGLYTDTEGDAQVNSIGEKKGINDHNLHILNASAISFDFLVGFLVGAQKTNDGAASYGVPAFTRPSVDLTDDNNDGDYGYPDGDGWHVAKWTVLSGTEDIEIDQYNDGALPPNTGPLDVVFNHYYLRHEAHAGDMGLRDDIYAEWTNVVSMGGAMGWVLWDRTNLPDENQRLYMASLMDDYNGSNNQTIGLFTDNSYRIDAVVTFYGLMIYDNVEELLELEFEDPIISPPICPDPTLPPDECKLSLLLAVKCLNVWRVAQSVQLTTNLGELSLDEVVAIKPDKIGPHLTAKTSPKWSAKPELGPGFIKFVRRFSTLDYYGPDDDPSDPKTLQTIEYDGIDPTIATFALNIIRYKGFGVAFYIPTFAYEGLVGSVI